MSVASAAPSSGPAAAIEAISTSRPGALLTMPLFEQTHAISWFANQFAQPRRAEGESMA
ncbi:hypothetical protein [Mycobacterium colombiense]|uniref:hypothetical protein n=1 Tax=Mycobacterium colombiense TaxID=339268 RepID=UPI0012DB6422|nr:hypothetical protein [Mycobacterium colombiense]